MPLAGSDRARAGQRSRPARSRASARRGRLSAYAARRAPTIRSSACARTARRAVTPVASVLGGTRQRQAHQNGSNVTPQVSGSAPRAGPTSFNFSNSRAADRQHLQHAEPAVSHRVTLNLTQPLWRGLRFDDNRHRMQVARKNQQLSTRATAPARHRSASRRPSRPTGSWITPGTTSACRPRRCRLAEQQYESNRRQAEQGVLAPDRRGGRADQVATFQQNLFAAQQALTAAENNLKIADAARPRAT